jgi:hypothetical protein
MMMDCRIADAFTASLSHLTADERKLVKQTVFDSQARPLQAAYMRFPFVGSRVCPKLLFASTSRLTPRFQLAVPTVKSASDYHHLVSTHAGRIYKFNL